MKKLALVIAVVLASLPSWGVNVRAEDQSRSLKEATQLTFMCMVIGCDENGTPVGLFGTGSLIRNDSSGAFALVAGHSIRDPGATQDRCPKWKLYFEPPILEGTKYNVMEVTDIFHYTRQDITLLKLNGLVTASDGTLIQPIGFYHGPLDVNTPLMIGGYGVSEEPDFTDPTHRTPLDYRRRMARVLLFHFGTPAGQDLTVGFTQYNTALQVPGIAANCDSGGFTAIESDGCLFMVGLIKEVRGFNTSAWTGFENFQYDDGTGQLFFQWLEETIAANSNDASAPTGNVTINGGAAYTANCVVTLTLNASDTKDANGVTQMRFSADGGNWIPWEPFAASTTWELPAGDGIKMVYAQFKDEAENVSSTCSDSVVLDTTPPVLHNQVVSTHMNTACAIELAVSGADSGVQVSGPTNGNLAGTGLSYDYTPAPFWVGSDLITVLAVDSAGNTATGTVTINVTNTAPVTVDQTVSTKMGSAVTVTPGVSDPNGDTITSYVVTPPSHGSLSGWTYTPAEGFSGLDSFTFQASDGGSESNIATVSIDVVYVATTGTLTVTLQPSSAVTAGAWAVDGGEWHASGETVYDLAAGAHVVTFKSIAASGRTAWVTPTSETVVVVAGQTVQATGTYTATTTQPTDFFTLFIQWLLSLFGLKF